MRASYVISLTMCVQIEQLALSIRPIKFQYSSQSPQNVACGNFSQFLGNKPMGNIGFIQLIHRGILSQLKKVETKSVQV